MFKLKLVAAFLLLLLLLTGCDLLKTQKDDLLFTSVTEVENQIKKKEWDQATSTISDFQELYNKRKWKIRLLGELDDYKGLEAEVISLKESLREEDEMESRIAIGQIMHRLHLIYNI
ncbi:DUF4363 family protein [Virgibacillus sp. C22-A2]|uniref:DUF4363 family protein n=1 Tax=Virgibacillus tibetensis TaxID=3042313 RepID=A0ABU6KFE0_9BACI|nr:DUF4363 family protein [Virgibacillus sp. C22-A2]